jgi:hypothetical protein
LGGIERMEGKKERRCGVQKMIRKSKNIFIQCGSFAYRTVIFAEN